MVNPYLMHRRKAFRASSNPLRTGLIAWYRMDESSGNAFDAHTGAYHLTQNGSVGTATGKVSGARSFSANSANFLSQSGSQFNFGNTTMYGAAWIYPVDTNLRNIAAVWDENNNNRQWILDQFESKFRFYLTSDGVFGAGNFAVATSSAYSVNEWNLVEFCHDATGDAVSIALNGGSFVTTSFNKGIFPGGTTPFRIGRSASTSPFDPIPFSGRVDEFAIWSRILTPEERNTLWNSGNGVGYPG